MDRLTRMIAETWESPSLNRDSRKTVKTVWSVSIDEQTAKNGTTMLMM